MDETTHHSPDVLTNIEREVDERDDDRRFEFVDQYTDQSRLEDVCVEKQQKDDDQGKYDAYILDAEMS